MKTQYATDENIGLITLDQAPYNQLESPLFTDPDELRDFLAQPHLKGIIIQGRGRHFSAGADRQVLADQLQEPHLLGEKMNRGKALLRLIHESELPVVAVIKGSCLGAGLEIALACHFRFAAPSAMLGFPEAELQLMPGFGGTFFGSTVSERRILIELMLSAKLISAEEARQIGLIDRIYPAKTLLDKAREYLNILTEKRSPHLIRAVMQAIHNSGRMSMEEALQSETALFLRVARNRTEQTKQ